MTDWKKVIGTQPERPQEVDKISSPTTVYLRRNIEQIERTTEEINGKTQTLTEWQYEEKEISVAEYEQMLLIYQIIEKRTEEIVKSVTKFQKERVIDEYTMQLIEEGVI